MTDPAIEPMTVLSSAALPTAALPFAFRGGELLVRQGPEGEIALPSTAELTRAGLSVGPFHRVGSVGGAPCYAFALTDAAAGGLPPGTALVGIRALYGSLSDAVFEIALGAVQIVAWDRTYRFCPVCATPLGSAGANERVKRCPSCSETFFPRLAPAVIVRVRRGDEILLARSPRFPAGMYSVLAGFVEPGETLETTVHREVLEEVGVRVANLRYFGSQPWPFPHSLMIAFTADYAAGELTPEPAEIEDVGWYRVDALPPVPPRLSIARRLIDAFVLEARGNVESGRT